ncbi:MAG: flippase-like domain-containing protein [bacterium]|nr:flippase-like domain-containing protein [bacterium]
MVVAAVLLGVAILIGLVLLADGKELLHTAAAIEPAALVEPLFFSFLSYVVMAASYRGIATAAGYGLPLWTWVRITLVSNTVNYIVTTAGISGFAVRMLLLGQQGVPSGRAVLISLAQTFITNFTLLAFCLAAFVSLLTRQQLHGGALVAATTLLVLFAAVLIYGLVLVLHRPLRRVTLVFIANATHRLLARMAPRWTPNRFRMWRFQGNLDQGFQFLLARKDRMVGPTLWICLDWVLTIGILWAAFRAVNHPLPPGVVLVGFGIGLFVSLVSFVPGGLGLLEGSMTAVFVSMGVPLEASVVAVLIFRLCYHVIPLLLSLFFFHGIVRQALARSAPARG